MRSRWSIAFAQLPGSQADKAAAWGQNKATISSWITGNRKPRPATLRAIEDATGIPAQWITEPVAPQPMAPRAEPSAVAVRATPLSLANESDALLGELQRHREYISSLDGADPAVKLRQLESCTVMMHNLAKMRGMLMSEAQILQSPAWERVMDLVATALEPWPDAMRALGNALVESSQ